MINLHRPTASGVRAAIALAGLVLLVALSAPTEAQAITRPEIIKRAEHWVEKKVPYSQSDHYEGYRQDCSGMVSMAWATGTSYTSSSIRSQARQVPRAEARPGDAVRHPGHVEIFAGWADKDRTRYVALAESTWGKPAMRKVRRFKSDDVILRYRGVEEEEPKPEPKPEPPDPITVIIGIGEDAKDTGGVRPPKSESSDEDWAQPVVASSHQMPAGDGAWHWMDDAETPDGAPLVVLAVIP